MKDVALGITSITVGSDPGCGLVLPDPLVSRVHLELQLTSQGIQVRDRESKNGTFANGLRIIEGFLGPEDRLQVGDCELSFQADSEKRVELSPEASFGEAVGLSVPMRALFVALSRVASQDSSILLLGETGTGKDILAQAVHAHSPRKEGPFVVVDCASLSPTLIEAELFGHQRGAFTGAEQDRAGPFEEAEGGTVLLDEIGELPREAQTRLLRALESKEVRRVGSSSSARIDVRVIAATHQDLEQRVREGLFRLDLFHRLAVHIFVVPPLRDRLEDIPLLVERLLAAGAAHNSQRQGALSQLPPGVLRLLLSHTWPGNVRELRNVLERVVTFPDQAALLVPGAQSSLGQSSARSLREMREAMVEGFERSVILERLRVHDGQIGKTAESLGISRQFLHRLMTRYMLKAEG